MYSLSTSGSFYIKTVRSYFSLHCNFRLADFRWKLECPECKKKQPTKTPQKPPSISELKGTILQAVDEKEQPIKKTFLHLKQTH